MTDIFELPLRHRFSRAKIYVEPNKAVLVVQGTCQVWNPAGFEKPLQSNSCTSRYNTAHENEPQWSKTNAEKSPNSPLLQRGRAVGPGDFCADRNFHKRCRGCQDKRISARAASPVLNRLGFRCGTRAGNT